MSTTAVKQAALISNHIRLGMHREDIAKTLVDIYADHGYKDIEQVANPVLPDSVSLQNLYLPIEIEEQLIHALKNWLVGNYLLEYHHLVSDGQKDFIRIPN